MANFHSIPNHRCFHKPGYWRKHKIRQHCRLWSPWCRESVYIRAWTALIRMYEYYAKRDARDFGRSDRSHCVNKQILLTSLHIFVSIVTRRIWILPDYVSTWILLTFRKEMNCWSACRIELNCHRPQHLTLHQTKRLMVLCSVYSSYLALHFIYQRHVCYSPLI